MKVDKQEGCLIAMKGMFGWTAIAGVAFVVGIIVWYFSKNSIYATIAGLIVLAGIFAARKFLRK